MQVRIASYARRALATSPVIFAAFGSQAALLVSGVITARVLGVDGRGAVALATLIATIAGFLAGLGATQLLNVLVAAHGRPREILRRCTRAVAPTIAVGSIGAAVVAIVILDDYVLAALIAVAVPPLVMAPLRYTAFYGAGRYWTGAWLQVANSLFYGFLLAGFLVMSELTTRTAVAAYAIAAYLSLAAGYVARLSDRATGERTQEALPETSDIRRRGLRGYLATYSPLETFRLDQIVVASIGGTYQLGLYTSALAFANLPRLVGQALSTYATRGLVQRERSGRDGLRFALMLALAVVVVAIPVAAISPFLLTLLFGSEFEGAAPVAVALSMVGAFMGARKVLNQYLRTLRKEATSSAVEIVASVAFVGFSLFFIESTFVALELSILLSIVSGVSLLAAVYIAKTVSRR